MKILLAIDGSDFSNAAVKELAKLHLPSNSEICVINVYDHRALPTSGLHSTKATFRKYPDEALKNANKIGNKIISEAIKVLNEKKARLL
ncbi:universal stress protein [Zunongwangia sp. H14]|uniref:universal stress protein n=1 Tax=Zunongwangia sp. H14 TaxID=3240792 RepID=UPI003568B38D